MHRIVDRNKHIAPVSVGDTELSPTLPLLFPSWWLSFEFCQHSNDEIELKSEWCTEVCECVILQASKQHRLKRYHSQAYVNGSKCDINGNPRETEVRVRDLNEFELCTAFKTMSVLSKIDSHWTFACFITWCLQVHLQWTLFFLPVCVWRWLRWLHCSSGWTPVVSLRADYSHESHLSASLPASAIHC